MRLWERRALTAGEVELGRLVFGDEILWPLTRVLQGPGGLGFGAMVPAGRTILFSGWRARRDFAAAGAGEQGWFVHELMHVWQAGRGVVLAGAKLGAIGKSAYRYKPRTGAQLAEFNIEQQAEIARHLFHARTGLHEADAPSKDWLEAVWATRLVRRRG